jgi:hypothetical protein
VFDHVTIPVADRCAVVDECLGVALAAGFRDNDAPGLRAYGADDHGSFEVDPERSKVEMPARRVKAANVCGGDRHGRALFVPGTTDRVTIGEGGACRTPTSRWS